MRMEINTQPENLLLPSKTEEILLKVLQKAAELLQLEPETEVSVLLVDNETIREMNRDYRNKDIATDVLSFPLEEEIDEYGEPAVIGGPTDRLLGDIVISVEKVAEQAREYEHSIERELAFLAVHGLLHLLGHDHETGPDDERIMRAEESRIMDFIGIQR